MESRQPAVAGAAAIAGISSDIAGIRGVAAGLNAAAGIAETERGDERWDSGIR